MTELYQGKVIGNKMIDFVMKTSKEYIEESVEADGHATAIDAVSLLISEAIEIVTFSYNDEITRQFADVICALKPPNEDGLCSSEISSKIGIDSTHVELIQYLICDKGFAEYWTSPRCCWLTPNGEELKRLVIEIQEKLK